MCDTSVADARASGGSRHRERYGADSNVVCTDATIALRDRVVCRLDKGGRSIGDDSEGVVPRRDVKHYGTGQNGRLESRQVAAARDLPHHTSDPG